MEGIRTSRAKVYILHDGNGSLTISSGLQLHIVVMDPFRQANVTSNWTICHEIEGMRKLEVPKT